MVGQGTTLQTDIVRRGKALPLAVPLPLALPVALPVVATATATASGSATACEIYFMSLMSTELSATNMLKWESIYFGQFK
jgi:hypothetical protein